PRMLVLGTLMATATFVLFYLTTVFSLTWGTTELGFSRESFLGMQLLGVLMFALFIPISALFADKHGRRVTMVGISLAIAVFGFALEPLLNGGVYTSMLFLAIGFALMGYTYGPLGTALAELFPANMRYTGASLTFNFAGILGASLAPYLAMWLATEYGLAAVGGYLSFAGIMSALAMCGIAETKVGSFYVPFTGFEDKKNKSCDMNENCFNVKDECAKNTRILWHGVRMKKTLQQGVTLIELMVAVVVLAII